MPSSNQSERDLLPPRMKARSDSLTEFFRSKKEKAELQLNRNVHVEPDEPAERLPSKHVIESKETAAAAAMRTLSPSSKIFSQNNPISQSEIVDKESDKNSVRKTLAEIRAADTCVDSEDNDAISINLD
jgi:hypothetical protein